ncbi:hypothetical protein DUNSADRAFT_10437 [Dunaliella salina]|uniref:Encoded protein n=1 Tax=Dunaliella salina TaxID=3046 RepID=A0ABQ7GFD1_DUNSA|nr:hypothetical protein DUNSADRAFT_10437 [Dunaliella salina]|eukprot:KAF5833317.1 hypothetical protein DUNSADRAFT_10437 [Dunaliella salina]
MLACQLVSPGNLVRMHPCTHSCYVQLSNALPLHMGVAHVHLDLLVRLQGIGMHITVCSWLPLGPKTQQPYFRCSMQVKLYFCLHFAPFKHFSWNSQGTAGKSRARKPIGF